MKTSPSGDSGILFFASSQFQRIDFTFDSAIGENLHVEQEPDSAVDKFAMKEVKNNETVGH